MKADQIPKPPPKTDGTKPIGAETPQQHLERMRRWRQEEKLAREAGKLFPPGEWPETTYIPRSSINALVQNQPKPSPPSSPESKRLYGPLSDKARENLLQQVRIGIKSGEWRHISQDHTPTPTQIPPPEHKEHPAAAFYRETRAARALISEKVGAMIYTRFSQMGKSPKEKPPQSPDKAD